MNGTAIERWIPDEAVLIEMENHVDDRLACIGHQMFNEAGVLARCHSCDTCRLYEQFLQLIDLVRDLRLAR